MKPTVYIETTIISYLTAWPSRDVVRLSHEIITRHWWAGKDQFQVHVSELVVSEISAGDPVAAADRLQAIDGIPLLPTSDDAIALAQDLAKAIKLPARAEADALHIGVAAVHGISFLLTWNCRHLANAAFTDRIERVCRDFNVVAPRIVTPELLMSPP